MSKMGIKWKEAVNAFHANPRLVAPLIAVLCGLIFAADVYEPNIIAISALYAIPLTMSLWLGNRRFTISLALICGVLAVIGVRADEGGDPNEPVYRYSNEVAAVFMIGVVSVLGLWRMQIERKMFDTREAVTTTLESIAEGVISTQVDGHIGFMNPMAEQLTEFAENEAIGVPLASVFRFVDERSPKPPIVEPQGRRANASIEGTLISKSGRRIPILLTRAPIRDADDEVHGQVIVFRDITVQKEHAEAMRRMAYRDELTGLPNRTSLADRISLELAHARRNREMLAICYVDLDRFKQINDSLGHAVGDQFLKAVADRLRAALRAGDTVARMGGDEFVILLPGVLQERDASIVAGKVVDALSNAFTIEGRELRAGASVGLALYPLDGDEAETLLRRADKAMYRAKGLGGSRVEFATPRAAPSGRA